MRLRSVLILTITLAACLAVTGRSYFSSSDVASTPPVVYTSAPKYDALAWIRGAERFPLGASILLKRGGDVRKLVPDLFASADANVSFDGKYVLFSGKKAATDPWQIWEVALDSGETKRIVSSKEDLVRPFYLPEDRVVYSRKQNGRYQLEAASRSGGPPLRLSYGPESALPTEVLRDGRILFESTYPLGAGQAPEIYTVYSDGSGVESYRCDHESPRYAGRQVSSGDVVFTHGPSVARFNSAMAHEVAIAAPKGEFAGDVAELSKNELLLAWHGKSKEPFRLVVWKPGTSTVEVFAASTENLLQPVPVRKRPVPNRHPSGLHDWSTANLLSLNSYTSKYTFVKDSIASVRLYTRDTDGSTKLLGSAPVERDGSFYMQVPGDQPLKFELLDAQGKSLKKQEGWMWVRSGEQRICVGCHAGPEHAPENAVPAVLLRSTTPADLTGAAIETRRGGH